MKPFMKSSPSGFVVPNFYSPTNKKPMKNRRYSWPGGYISTVGRVKEIDWEKKKPPRAGIIVYNFYQDKVLLCMGVDRKTKELTDFGGGISYKLDKNAIRGAIREFTEESLGVFGEIEEKDLAECVVAYTCNMAIIFLPLACNPEEITKLFISRYSKEKVGEVSSLAWMEAKTFLTTLYKKKKIYIRVYKLLMPVILKIFKLL